MASWLRRTQTGTQSAPTTAQTPTSAFPTLYSSKTKDPNAPDIRLDVESKCIYERRLPGNAYITAHVTRLQDGFYDTPSTHGDRINNVRFIAISFVFHPSETINRFQAATISITLHDDTDQKFTDPSAGFKSHLSPPTRRPKFLRFAPHVLYGGVSPETLDWNFNLTGSLGVSQTPVSASMSPSGGLKGSYKVYQMMRIQGSTRTSSNYHHRDYDLEDGEVFWTLEENPLQKSGLPREFTFVMLATKGDIENVVFEVDIQPRIASWFGHYPNWWCNLVQYLPFQKETMDIDKELGQKFLPEEHGGGYNFANLACTFNAYVSLPGTTVSANDSSFSTQSAASPEQQEQSSTGQKKQQPQPAQPAQQGGAAAKQPSSQPSQSQSQSQSNDTPAAPTRQPTTSNEPHDYHLYLDNPRSIIIHASSPAPPSDKPQQRSQNQKPLSRPQSQAESHSELQTQPKPQSSESQLRVPKRPTSNTKLKRRSIDISYMSPPPSQNQRQASLRHSCSPDLHIITHPIVEVPEVNYSSSSSLLDKEHVSPIRSSTHSAQHSLLQVNSHNPVRNGDSTSPPRPRRNISPYAQLSNEESQNKRYSMPAYTYVQNLDD